MQSPGVMDQHRKALGILYLVFGGLWAVAGLVILGLFVAGAVPAATGRERTLILLMGVGITALLLAMAAAGLIGGVGMMKRRAWSKLPILIAGILSLLNFPVGTMLGIYTLWFWLQPNTEQLFFPRASEPRGPEPGGPNLQRPVTT